MSDSAIQTQGTQYLIEPIIVISASKLSPQIGRIARICWNTGEEKTVLAATLAKAAKPKLDS
jgi:hypothetical protein